MRLLALLTFASLLLSGCADDTAPAAAPLDAVEAPSDAPPQNRTALATTTAPPAPDLSNRTVLHWATDAALGDTAFEVVVDFGRENRCEVASTAAGASHGGGTRSVFVWEHERGYAWGAGGGGSMVTAYAGPVDTRTLTDGPGHYASGSWSRGGFSGVVTLTRVALGVEPWDNSISGDKSLSLDIECEEPFSVLRARVGHEVLVASAESMQGGAGADAYLAGSAMVQATAGLRIDAPAARMMMGHFGDEAGRVVASHPDGETTWTTTALDSRLASLDGGPGDYSFTVDRLGVRFEAFWLTAFGLADEVDLLAGLQDGPTYTPRF